jgi:hypothetical protein
VELDCAELVECFLELAGEAVAVESEGGDRWDQDFGAGGCGEEVGFEERDAVEAPGGVSELLDKLGFGWSGGLVFGEKLAAVLLEGGWIFRRQDGRASQSMAKSVERRTLFTGLGARAGGVLGIGAIDGRAIGVVKLDCCCSWHDWSPGHWDSTSEGRERRRFLGCY